MKPASIITVDTNPEYLFLLPIVVKSWELQGFEPHVRLIDDEANVDIWDLMRRYVDNFTICGTGIKCDQNKAIYTQCLRLYMATEFSERYVILTDVDMFIASSFLYRDFDKVNVFGHDLTDRNHIPICYAGMTGDKWREAIGKEGMNADIIKYGDVSSKEKAWCCDQDILTAKLKAYGYDRINFIDRGTDPKNLNLPKGRWDRYGGFKKPKGQIHDVHLPRNPYSDENFKKILDMCEDVYPKENWNWLIHYKREFKKCSNILTN